MITPCIRFQGNCDEAISFYKEALASNGQTSMKILIDADACPVDK